MRGQRKRVGVFAAGYVGADIRRTCRILNSVGRRYRFEWATSLQNLGEPDLWEYGYSDDRFRELMQPHMGDYDVCVVFTSVPIQGNYFSGVLSDQLVVCTSHDAEQFARQAGRTMEQYFALLAAPELLCIEYNISTGEGYEALYHKDVAGCAFDWAGVKSQIVAFLTALTICDRCRGKLAAHNVNREAVEFLERLLTRIRQPTILNAVCISVTSPLLSFAYGGVVLGFVVNLLSSLALAKTWQLSTAQNALLWSLLGGIFVFPAAVFGVLWLRYFRQTRRIAA